MDCSNSSKNETPSGMEPEPEKGFLSWSGWLEPVLTIVLLPVIIPLLLLYFVVLAFKSLFGIFSSCIDDSRKHRIKRFHFHEQLRQAGRLLSMKQASKRIEKEGGTLICYDADTWWTPDDLFCISPFPPHSEEENKLIERSFRFSIPKDAPKICFDWDHWCAEHYLARNTGKGYYLRSGPLSNIKRTLTRRHPNLKHFELWNPADHSELSTFEEIRHPSPEMKEKFWDEYSLKDNLPAPRHLNRFYFPLYTVPTTILFYLLIVPVLLTINIVFVVVFSPVYLIFGLYFLITRIPAIFSAIKQTRNHSTTES